MRAAGGLLVILLVLATGCGPSIEDSVEKLAGGPEEREEGRQELLLAKDRAVDPLLEAFEDPEYSKSRPELAEVLAGLLARVDDPRVEPTLYRHLVSDPDSLVRARIAHRVGLYYRKGAIGSLLEALQDTVGSVRHQALWALRQMEADLDSEQQESLRQHARRLATDEHRGARREAAIRVEAFVDGWLGEAREQELKAQLAAAESLFTRALTYAPASKRANYRFARFRFDNGEREAGLTLLRQQGMVLDAPLLTTPPVVDGRLDEPVWETAACVDSFFQYSSEHHAAVPSDVAARICVGYLADALYFGFYGHDAHPDSLVARSSGMDQELWHEDIVELFIDPGFDHREYVHVGVNSRGAVADGLVGYNSGDRDTRWQAEADVAAEVGRDHWSMEYCLRLGQADVPVARAGDIWGFNFVRVYRGAEYSQWVRTYTSGGHSPDDFGVLRFN